jgi:hypothetical protein
MKGKQLFFGMSIALPLDEAVEFKKSLGNGERYYLLKVRECPKDKHINRRERYAVVRRVRMGERVDRGYAVYGDRGGLV